jgi:hypothetical protein
MATFKIQSAMEYLMTYGWALLIISIVIVALVSIGVFNGNPLGTTCIATPGYTCQVVQYYAIGSATPGNMLVIIGQDSGTSWTSTSVYFVNTSAESTVQSSGLSSATTGTGANTITSLSSGVTTTVLLPVNGGNKAGSAIQGYIWAAYTPSGSSGSTVNAQIASVTAKAT